MSVSRGRNTAARLSGRRTFTVLSLVLFLLVGGCGQGSQQPTVQPAASTPTPVSASPAYWPTTGWRASTPEEQGVDSQQLLKALQHVDEAGINLRSLTVIRNGYTVLEAYYQPWTADLHYPVYSVTKSVTGALVGIALAEGYLKDIKQPVLSFFPDMTAPSPTTGSTTTGSPTVGSAAGGKEAITVEDLLTMRPGLDCSDARIGPVPPQDKNWVQFALNLPMASPPGRQFAYCTVGPHILSAILTRVTGMSTAAYAQTRLFDPLGIHSGDIVWSTDPQGINTGGFGLFMKPSDMAKLGLLYLNDGKWDGKQVVPARWVAASSTAHVADTGGVIKDKKYGYLMWVYSTHYAAEGLGEQMIEVVKDRNMVVVMTAAINDPKGPTLLGLLRDYIIPAAASDKPLPPNPTSLAALQEKVKYLADPAKPVPPLPAIARQISGKTYVMQNNLSDWKTLTLNFEEGRPEMSAALVAANGEVTVTVGMDNVYRVQESPGGNFIARRGQWVDDHTFVAREIQSGGIEETEMSLSFTGNDLKIHVQEMIFGAMDFDMKGSAK